MRQVVDAWIHRHKHGDDVYLFFRRSDEPLTDEDAVIDRVKAVTDFEPEEGEYVEEMLNSVLVPFNQPKDGMWAKEDPKYPVEDWLYEVDCEDTRLGYWDWVDSQEESENDD